MAYMYPKDTKPLSRKDTDKEKRDDREAQHGKNAISRRVTDAEKRDDHDQRRPAPSRATGWEPVKPRPKPPIPKKSTAAAPIPRRKPDMAHKSDTSTKTDREPEKKGNFFSNFFKSSGDSGFAKAKSSGQEWDNFRKKGKDR